MYVIFLLLQGKYFFSKHATACVSLACSNFQDNWLVQEVNQVIGEMHNVMQGYINPPHLALNSKLITLRCTQKISWNCASFWVYLFLFIGV